jgi:hypothetical protein
MHGDAKSTERIYIMLSSFSRRIVPPKPDRMMHKPKILWIDGVGGFAMCDASETSLGQSFPSNEVDLAIRGDLSRRAAIFRRSGDGHWIQPFQSVSIRGAQIERATLLADGDLLDFGNRLLLRYNRPTKLSGTGRLEIASQHRWQPSLSGTLLLGESCILGSPELGGQNRPFQAPRRLDGPSLEQLACLYREQSRADWRPVPYSLGPKGPRG